MIIILFDQYYSSKTNYKGESIKKLCRDYFYVLASMFSFHHIIRFKVREKERNLQNSFLIFVIKILKKQKMLFSFSFKIYIYI